MAVYQMRFPSGATAERVWEVLTDLDRYGEWNPQIPTATGEVAEGSEIELHLVLPGPPHGGRAFGAATLLLRLPEAGWSVCILSNYDRPADKVVFAELDRILAEPQG